MASSVIKKISEISKSGAAKSLSIWANANGSSANLAIDTDAYTFVIQVDSSGNVTGNRITK